MSISTANSNIATFNRYLFNAVGGETSLSGVDANGNTLSYTVGKEQVYLNGVMLVRGTDYVATTGTSITSLTALVASDVVEVIAYGTFVVATAMGAAQTTPPTAPVEGLIWLDTDGTVPSYTLTRWSKSPSAGTTTLSGTDDTINTLAYTAGFEKVYINGTLLSRGNDYTATDGTTIALTSATLAGDLVEVFSQSAYSYADNIGKASYTTKGDILAATASTTPTRLGVGSDDQVLVADSTASTGMAWKSYGSQAAAGKNFVINGGMDIWQRGTSISLAASTAYANGYTTDRWFTATGTNQACTVSRQATGDTTNLPNIQYCMRYQRNSGQTGTAALGIAQAIETANSIPLAGKTITFSFYARAGSNFSASSSILGVQLFAGTATDQNPYIGGYTGQTIPINTTQAITTTWTRYTFTVTLATTITELTTNFYFTPVGTASTNDYFEITGVQLELGSTATPFARAGGTIQGELAACQRYYWRSNGTTYNVFYGEGLASSTTLAYIRVKTPVTMRVLPTSIDYSTLRLSIITNSFAMTSAAIIDGGIDNVVVQCSVASGLTAATQMYMLYTAANANGYLGFSAEL